MMVVGNILMAATGVDASVWFTADRVWAGVIFLVVLVGFVLLAYRK